MFGLRPAHVLVLIASLLCIGLSLWRLEAVRAGIEITTFDIGDTPATLYRQPGGDRRLVVVSHGFAGSRQLMEAWSLTLAQAGHAVVAFDYFGHGRHGVAMSGDVESIEGTTRQLIAQTTKVIDAGLELPGTVGPVAILGHSMATDVITRAALEDPRIADVIGISMFSSAVSASAPPRLLMINGEWEARLRDASVAALQLVDPSALEGDTAQSDQATRRAVAAPRTEHVSVLYSPEGLGEARDWLGPSDSPVATIGYPIVGLMAGLVALAWPLSQLLPAHALRTPRLAAGRFAITLILPALIAPLVATRLDVDLLPVLIADYLMVHFAILGLGQLGLYYAFGGRIPPLRLPVLLALIAWGILVFGLALDHYVASFWPSGPRWSIILALLVGTLPAMLADAVLTEGGHAPVWRRLAAKLAFFGSLALAVYLDFDGLLFLLFIVPVIVLFFLVFGLFGRWSAARSSATTAGLGLGVILAWSLGVSFPLFVL